MLRSTTANAPQSSRMSSPVNAPLSKETGTYLGTGALPESDNCRFQGSAQRSVTIAHISDLPATADPAMQDSEGNTLFCLAAQDGNLAQAEQLILRGADVHHINLDGNNALMLAAAGGHLTFIKWLDSHCPQPVNHENYYAETALTLAARHGHQPLVQWLVSRDASLTHLNDQLKDALAEAVANGHMALVQWLAANDTDLRQVYPDGNNLFLHAVRAGHQGMAQWLEGCGVDSQQINESGDSAFTLAARYGHHQLLAWLLEKNAGNIHQISRNGDNLVLMAARRGHCQTVKLLVQHGVDTALVHYAGSNVLTLAAASSEPLALWLCSIGSNIHHIDFSGDNAFTLAAQSGFFQLMQTLEQLGINIHQVNHNNDNAFTLVARQGSLSQCQWLAGKGINIHQVNSMHHNAFTLAALAGSQPLLEWLRVKDIDWQQIPRTSMYDSESPNSTWLSYSFNAAILAASAGHFAQAQWLMRQGLDIRQRDCYARNGVIQAVGLGRLDAVQWFIAQGIMPDGFPDRFPKCFKRHQHNAMSLAAHLGHLHILQWLHQHGSSLDAKNDGRTLLTLAARRGDLPMTQWLCRQGADLERLDSVGFSALGSAVRHGHLRVSQWLIGQGAEIICDVDDIDAESLAARRGHNAIFRWLIRSKRLDERQANDLLLPVLRSGQRSLAVWLCLNVPDSFLVADKKNRNALMFAAENGFLWLTQWFSEHALDANQTSRKGYTALIMAAANGHLPVVQWLYLEKNANLHQKGLDHADALHLAVIGRHTETVKWLIDQGMVLNRDYFRRKTLPWIRNRNNVGLLQNLLRQQLPLRLFREAMLDAASNGDIPALACCLSAGISLRPSNDDYERSCFIPAVASGSLATLEFLCHYSDDYDAYLARNCSLLAAARCGNLHIIQWFCRRSRLSRYEKNCCLYAASARDHFHVVKWLYKQGADIGAKSDRGGNSLSTVVCGGNIPMLEWFCQQGGDLHQVKKNGKGALSLAIDSREPQTAMWLFRRGFRLSDTDIGRNLSKAGKSVLAMIFKMTSGIGRANLFHSLNLNHKLWLLEVLQLHSDSKELSTEEADASFARFNQYSDKTLEHKCLVTLAKLIGQQAGTLEAGLKVIDNLSISSDCKHNLRELVIISLE